MAGERSRTSVWAALTYPYGTAQTDDEEGNVGRKRNRVAGPQLKVGLRNQSSGEESFRIAIVDSGSTISVLPKEWLDEIGAKPVVEAVAVWLGDGSVALWDEYLIELHFSILGWRYWFVFGVRGKPYGVVGRNILRSCALELDGVRRIMRIWDPKAPQ